jgi:hypothetical protein
VLQLLEVGLMIHILRISWGGSIGRRILQRIYTYLKIASLGLSTSQSLADAVSEVLGLTGVRDRANGLLLEFDRHGGLNGGNKRI